MKFEPKTDEEIQVMGLWPEGEYGFEILDDAVFGDKTISTMDTTSRIKPDGSGGNEMIQLIVRVFNLEGQSTVIIDYLLAAMPKKLKHAAYTCGLGQQYEMGTLHASDFIGKQGNVKLVIQKGREKDDGSGKHPDKNSISDYIASNDVNAPLSKPSAGSPPIDELEDSIPFMRYELH